MQYALTVARKTLERKLTELVLFSFCTVVRKGQSQLNWPVGCFLLPPGGCEGNTQTMSRRVKKKASLFAPLAENLAGRLAKTNTQTRRRLTRWGAWIFAVLFIYSLMIGTFSIPRIVRLDAERRHLLTASRLQAAALIDACRVRDMLKYDKLYIEQIARQRFHLVYPDETLYRYSDQ